MQLVKQHAISSGFADDTYNSLNAFYLTSPSGAEAPVRWSAVAMQPFVADDPAAHTGVDKNYLFDELLRQLEIHALKWRLVFTMGEAGDPTRDATLPWPKERSYRQAAATAGRAPRAGFERRRRCRGAVPPPRSMRSR